jgi:hypothetical protein
LRKIVLILFTIFFLGSCSVTRKVKNSVVPEQITPVYGNILEEVIGRNITTEGFFIKKAEITYVTKNGKQKFLGTIKFEFPDKFLISLKSKTGIEGARIYISKDSLIVNDRINKKMYFGKASYLKRKFGVDQSLIPLLFGDLFLDKNIEKNSYKCSNDKLKLDCIIRGVKIDYEVDCKSRKLAKVNLTDNYLRQSIMISNKGFINYGSIAIPEKVEINNLNDSTIIKLRFIKVEFPWNGTLKFIPGKEYEKIELL